LSAARTQPIHEGRQQVELFGVVVLGTVVLARDRTEDVLGDLVRLVDDELEALGNFQIHH
jgi:hypothetical protein